MRLLIVGDPHVVTDELADCEGLLTYVSKIADENEPDLIVFTGDLFHSHSVLHLPVLNFWEKWFTKLSRNHKVLALVGNHDQELKDPFVHALKPFKQIIVADPYYVTEDVAFASYHGSNRKNDLLKFASENSEKALVVHETFIGAQLTESFYAPDGFEQEEFPNKVIISGHIHKPCELGKVLYVGSPRWRTVSDSNTNRYVYLMDVSNGKINEATRFATEGVCCPIYTVSLPEEQDRYNKIKDLQNARVIITLSGSEEEVANYKKDLTGVKSSKLTVKENITTEQVVTVKESLGVFEEFNRFKNEFIDKHNLNSNNFNRLVNARINSNL